MSTTRQAIAEAAAELKRLAAKESVRMDEAAAELAKLEAEDLVFDADLNAAVDAGDDATATKLIEAKQLLELRISQQRRLLSDAQAHRSGALEEIKTLQAKADEVEVAPLRGAGVPTFDTSAEATALNNARRAINALDAEVALNAELAGDTQQEAALGKEIAKVDARATLAKLKAERDARNNPGGDADESLPKKTL